MQVVSGRVAYERTVKDDDYGINRKFSGEFSFTVEPSENWLEGTSDVGNQLVALVHHKLSVKGVAKATVSVGTAAQQPVVATPATTPAGNKEAAANAMNKVDGKGPTEAPKAPRGPGRPKKEAPVADPLAAMTGAAVAASASEASAPADPLADLGAAAPEKDELADILGDTREDAPAPVVTDADLSKAITKKAGELRNGPRIRALAEKFGGGPLPKQIRDIPADQRWAFVQELNALQPK